MAAAPLTGPAGEAILVLSGACAAPHLRGAVECLLRAGVANDADAIVRVLCTYRALFRPRVCSEMYYALRDRVVSALAAINSGYEDPVDDRE